MLLLSCGSEPVESQDVEHISEDTIVLDTVVYNYENCPKAWNLEEAMAAPDSFCQLALLGFEKKYTEVPREIEKMTHLRVLDMHSNNITYVPAFLGALTSLDLSSNLLKKCPTGLENVPLLRSLDLSYNPITELDPAIFSMLNLEELMLYNTKLTKLPKELFNLSKLRKLALSSNALSEIPTSIGKLTALEELYLNDMYLGADAFPESMRKLKSLKSLYIGSSYSGGGEGNQFDSIPDWVFDLDSLQQLNLNHGQIELISPKIGQLRNLVMLNLEGNNISELPKEIAQLTQLEYLYLGWNQFTPEQETEIRSWFPERVEIFFDVEVGD